MERRKHPGKSHEERAARSSLESSTPGKEESMLNSACNCALPLSCQLLFIPGYRYCIFNFCIAPQLYASVVISSKSLKVEWLIQGSRYILRSMITSKKDLALLIFFSHLYDTVSERSNFWEDRFTLAHSLREHSPSWEVRHDGWGSPAGQELDIAACSIVLTRK